MEKNQRMHNEFMKNANLTNEERKKFEQDNQKLLEQQKQLNQMFQNYGNYK